MKSTSTRTPWWKKFFSREFARFLLVGATNTGFGYVIYAVCLTFVGYRLAYTVSFVLSVIFSYWLNSHFVFKVKMSVAGLLKFPLVYVVQYLVGIGLMYVLVGKLQLSPYLAPIAVVVLTIPITFLMSRILIRGSLSG
ncbi:MULTISPECIES: GtrA family protein [Pandoraea]|uniref:GtrA/DPMS transmembrane domain-containing protein n=1 Tax=Pandoraea capi TaxID=2508286 RepID=A0ABY6W1I8_9BURK|nr:MULTISPECIES: GtrA family protein [Pandoraea]MCI3205734.1 GtrA family protein [Pandoraea sp. LA3]MDN4583762.1 GtrA family protein [Pandoraea capi]VVE07286.1 hypothetical protein PCA20602_02446 [Pandoraea capi]